METKLESRLGKKLEKNILRNIKLTIEYDGTNYQGWQSQVNGPSLQDTIEGAIFSLTGEKVKIIGSGRTDSGVHAWGQVANFYTYSAIPEEKFSFALNTFLPADVKIKKSKEVEEDFHSRFSAKGKKYGYLIYNSSHPSPLWRHRAYHVYYQLNIEEMKQATKFFMGSHDFEAFMAKGGKVTSTVREITELNISQKDEIIQIDIAGNGFLYNMVRIIVGTLIEVGLGKIEAEDIKNIIKEKDRKLGGKTVPAQGLYLVEVYY